MTHIPLAKVLICPCLTSRVEKSHAHRRHSKLCNPPSEGVQVAKNERIIPLAQGGHLECSMGKDHTENEVAAAAVSTLPCFVFISLWEQKAE